MRFLGYEADRKAGNYRAAKDDAQDAQWAVDHSAEVKAVHAQYEGRLEALRRQVGQSGVVKLLKNPKLAKDPTFRGEEGKALDLSVQNLAAAELEALRDQLVAESQSIRVNREFDLSIARAEFKNRLRADARQLLDKEANAKSEWEQAKAEYQRAQRDFDRKKAALETLRQQVEAAEKEKNERQETLQAEIKRAPDDPTARVQQIEEDLRVLREDLQEVGDRWIKAWHTLQRQLPGLESEITLAGERLLQQAKEADAAGKDGECVIKLRQAREEVVRAFQVASQNAKCLVETGKGADLERWRKQVRIRSAQIKSYSCSGRTVDEELTLLDLRNMKVTEAETILRDLGLRTMRGMEHQPASTDQAGLVKDLSPAPGATVRVGDEITLEIYMELRQVPFLRLMPVERADLLLNSLGLFAHAVACRTLDPQVPPAMVYEQSVAGGELVLPGTSVILWYRPHPGEESECAPPATTDGTTLDRGAEVGSLEHGPSAPGAWGEGETKDVEADPTAAFVAQIQQAEANCDYLGALSLLDQLQRDDPLNTWVPGKLAELQPKRLRADNHQKLLEQALGEMKKGKNALAVTYLAQAHSTPTPCARTQAAVAGLYQRAVEATPPGRFSPADGQTRRGSPGARARRSIGRGATATAAAAQP